MRPWDETPGSPGLPFNVNRSQSFLGVWLGWICIDSLFPDICHVTMD